MHELSLTQGILEAALSHAGELKKIVEVRVRVGCLMMVNPEQLEFCFSVVAKGTIAEDARLVVEIEKARGRCADGHETEVEVRELTVDALTPLLRCAVCGEGVMIEGGRSLYLVSIEGE